MVKRRQGSIGAETQRDGRKRFRARVRVGSVRESVGLYDTREEAEAAIARRLSVEETRARVAKPRRSAGHVYIARCEELGLVKIGWATVVSARVKVIDAHSPARVVLEWSAPGSLADERALHRIVHARRERWEWFRLTRDEVQLLVAKWEQIRKRP